MKIIIGIFGLVTIALMSAGVVIVAADFVKSMYEILSGDDKQKGKRT